MEKDFWITDDGDLGCVISSRPTKPSSVLVIEYLAYDELKKENEELKTKLESLVLELGELARCANEVVGIGKRTGVINDQNSDTGHTFRELEQALAKLTDKLQNMEEK